MQPYLAQIPSLAAYRLTYTCRTHCSTSQSQRSRAAGRRAWLRGSARDRMPLAARTARLAALHDDCRPSPSRCWIQDNDCRQSSKCFTSTRSSAQVSGRGAHKRGAVVGRPRSGLSASLCHAVWVRMRQRTQTGDPHADGREHAHQPPEDHRECGDRSFRRTTRSLPPRKRTIWERWPGKCSVAAVTGVHAALW